MLIGKDFEKIEFSLFGFDLLEPNAFVGDTIILFVAIIFILKLRKFDQSIQFFKNWNYFYFFFGIGMFLGGVGHLMFNYWGFYGKYAPWIIGIISIYFAEKAMISLLSKREIFNKIILIKMIMSIIAEIFVFYFVDMTKDHSVGLRIPVINSLLGFIFFLGILGFKFKKEIHNNFIYMVYSVLIMIPSGIFIAFKINIHQWFDKNDFGHLVFIIVMIFFYKSIRSYAELRS